MRIYAVGRDWPGLLFFKHFLLQNTAKTLRDDTWWKTKEIQPQFSTDSPYHDEVDLQSWELGDPDVGRFFTKTSSLPVLFFHLISLFLFICSFVLFILAVLFFYPTLTLLNYRLVAAFAEGPHFSSLEKQLSETRKQTNDLQRRLHTLEQEIGNNNPTIFQEFSKATGVKKSILSDRLDRCYQKCLSQAKLEWLKQSANSRRLLQEV